MHRLHRDVARASASCACFCAMRSFRKDLSPDRTHTEQIQDAQNRFVWHRKHVFRPHQHFTYDPSNWSRPLEAQHKRQEQPLLSIVERVRAEQERQREREVNKRGSPTQQMPICDAETKAPKHEVADDDQADFYFFSPHDVLASPATPERADGWDTVSLQEMLDAACTAQVQISSPRFRGNESMALSNRLRSQLRELLARIFDKLEHAVVDETVSLNALVYAWFVLFASRQDLLLGLSEHGSSTERTAGVSAADASMRRIAGALQGTLFSPSVAPRLAMLPLDGLVEALYLLTHPSTRPLLMTATTTTDDALLPIYAEAVPQLITLVGSAMTHAAVGRTTPSSDEADSEDTLLLDPPHLAALGESLQRSCSLPSASHTSHAQTDIEGLVLRCLPSYVRYLNKTSDAIFNLLRASLPVSAQQQVHRALTRSRSTPSDARTAGGDTGGHARPTPRAIVLDDCGSPRGVQQPRTEPDDVPNLIRAYEAALGLMRSASSPELTRGTPLSPHTVTWTMQTVLRLLAHTPNYDLPTAPTLRVIHQLIPLVGQTRSRHDTAAETEANWLRLGLLLSRMDVTQCPRHRDVYTTFIDLCCMPEPDFESVRARSEWRRLRGVAMQRILSVATVPFLNEMEDAQKKQDGAVQSWEVAAALGAASRTGTPTILSGALCDEACAARVGGVALLYSPHITEALSASHCDLETALALVILRARLNTRRSGRPWRGVDDIAARYVAACVHIATGGRTQYASLMRNDDGAWQSAAEHCASRTAVHGDSDAIFSLFSDMKAHIEGNLSATSRVMTFC